MERTLDPERASALCLDCGLCCKGVVAYLPRTPFIEESRALQWMGARGIQIIEVGNTLYKVRIPSVCPHLLPDNRCDIYEERPVACREYDGRKSDIDCKWKNEV